MTSNGNSGLEEMLAFFHSQRAEFEAYPQIVETQRLTLHKFHVYDWTSIMYEIRPKQMNQTIGEITLVYDGEILYRVQEPFRGNGYATEAVCKLLEVWKKKDFYLSIDEDNEASKRVAEKLGFVYKKERSFEGTMVFVKES